MPMVVPSTPSKDKNKQKQIFIQHKLNISEEHTLCKYIMSGLYIDRYVCPLVSVPSPRTSLE